MKTLLALFVLLLSTIALANNAEHVGMDEGIPFGKIGIQALNLGILLIALLFFIRKSVVEIFVKRQEAFNEQSQKTALILKQAESELKEIKDKLSLLQSTVGASIQRAQLEAEIVKAKMIQDATTQAEKIKSDVALIINAEVYKAKNEIRNQIIEKAILSAKESVRTSTQSITERSEKSFISDLGQVKA